MNLEPLASFPDFLFCDISLKAPLVHCFHCANVYGMMWTQPPLWEVEVEEARIFLCAQEMFFSSFQERV